MSDWISSFSDVFGVWTITRAAGITSFLLLFFSMVFGILQGYPNMTPKAKSILYTLHESTSWYGLLIAALHTFVLLFDKYVGYSLTELLIPFTDSSKPILNGLGTIGFYLILLLIITSDLRHKMKRSTWKAIHYLAFVSFVAALIHGIFVGTDTKYWIVQLLYWFTGFSVIALILLRPSKKSNS
jgi:sulfoxide reductase heme-binding subunit YedZ